MKRYLCWKSSCSGMQMLILCRSTCFEKVTLLWISLFWTRSSIKKVPVPNKFPTLALKKWSLWKSSCWKEESAPKKYLLRKSNCCFEVVTLKKWLLCGSAFYEEKAFPKVSLSWKSLYICEKGNYYLIKIFPN